MFEVMTNMLEILTKMLEILTKMIEIIDLNVSEILEKNVADFE